MNYLIIDTETDGFFDDFDAPFTNLNNWPQPKQIAWLVCDDTGIPKETRNFFPKDEPERKETLRTLIDDLVLYKPTLVGHNIIFDRNVIGAELTRFGFYNQLLEYSFVCTMDSTVHYCNLENRKWPRLQELYFKVFSEQFKGAHDALNDAEATARCFFNLKAKDFNFIFNKQSLSDYKSYEEEILVKRKDRQLNICKAFALVELLRLFKLSSISQIDTIDQEVDFYYKNYYNFSLEFPLDLKDQFISPIQKQFFNREEEKILAFFAQEKKLTTELSEANQKYKKEFPKEKLLIGSELSLLVIFRFGNYDLQPENATLIAKEFLSYLFSYELYRKANERRGKNEGSQDNITSSDVIQVLRDRVSRGEVDLNQALYWLMGLYQPEVFNEKSFRVEDWEKRKLAIKDDLLELEKTLNLILPKITQIEVSFRYIGFLDALTKAVPDEFKPEMIRITKSFIKYFDKSKSCYIATLCYGAHDAPQVLMLRNYRDKVLLKTPLGRLFVKVYYLTSPSVVKGLKRAPWVTHQIKILILNPIVTILTK